MVSRSSAVRHLRSFTTLIQEQTTRQRRRSERAAAASAAAGPTEADAATLDSRAGTEAEQVVLAGVTVARREIRGGEGA